MSRSTESLGQELVDYADLRGMFFARVVEGRKWMRTDLHDSIVEHGTILRPILEHATACYAYGLVPGTEPYEAVADIVTKDRGRYRLDLSNDPISGREFFWNANAAKRGTIVAIVPLENNPVDVFRHCSYVSVMSNSSAGHSPGGFRYAQKIVEQEPVVAYCFPRNNGFEWMDVVAGKGRTAALFREAFELSIKRENP